MKLYATCLGISRIGRSSIYFTSLQLMNNTWSEEGLSHQLSIMPCLVALIKTSNFEDALSFVDRISAVKGNPVKSKKKHLVLHTPYIDQKLLENKTIGNINVHIISPDVTGMGL